MTLAKAATEESGVKARPRIFAGYTGCTVFHVFVFFPRGERPRNRAVGEKGVLERVTFLLRWER